MKKKLRNISGVVFIDKPKGLTSQQVVYRVRRAYRAVKAGHTGSLDPLATGMLPICLGEATKFADFLLTAKKSYQVLAQLGQCTTTGDAEGDITKEQAVTAEMLQNIDKVIPQFLGTIQQIPPMYSALKHQGQPLYRLARRGETIERAPREVTIEQMQRLPCSAKDQIALQVTCSKGTYIRTLVEDIGNALGCGAHVLELHRLQVDTYTPHQMVSLEFLENCAPIEADKLIFPLNTLIYFLPIATIATTLTERIQNGHAVKAVFSSTEMTGKWQIITEAGDFLGLGERQEVDIIAPKRLLSSLTGS